MSTPPAPDDALDALLATYRTFAREIAEQGSRVYATLCRHLAEDPSRAAIALRAAPAFRTPLILLAAVHHLLLEGAVHPLGAYYATVAGPAARAVDDDLYPAFAAFVDERRARIEDLVATHTTQTNEARRTVITLPALGLVERRAGRPLAVLEIGASAGLNLLVDRYRIRIGSAPFIGGDSPVLLECEVEGDLLPPLPSASPAIAWRRGLDLNPLDVADPATGPWLRALVWPEHLDRMAILRGALAVARSDPPLVLRGDLTEDLPAVAAGAPRDAELVVTSTWTLAYVDSTGRARLLDRLGEIARARDESVWLVAGEAQSVLADLAPGAVDAPAEGFGPSTLSLHRFDPRGARQSRLLAECHPHGRWMRWLDPDTGTPA